MGPNEIVSFIWQGAYLLYDSHPYNEYKKFIFPFIVLRRLNCVLESIKSKSLEISQVKNKELVPNKIAGQSFHNRSQFNFKKLKAGALSDLNLREQAMTNPIENFEYTFN
ncbi:MAG: type I restriction-modification system subunit M N-terminal domain-containing protein [Bdellovibrionales bacterium]|nr:type I restriction-modification system subunit M N-terminal domain-containing protein [Bdellovibrionales bacterium]